ncbi:hypothetical protein [Galactobacillus timonensis]|uniref:hypothetical protein n=1 Tax=Galactobacillus timonensis TaxID=2041840 RepID=UPI000C841DE2|nr:hypothetical protein [Galactobacillus timonensis]
MSEDCYWVNIDTLDFFDPFDLGYGPRITESCGPAIAPMRALYELIETDWKNSRLIFWSDQCPISSDTKNPALKELLKKNIPWVDWVLDNGRNFSGQFKEADEDVKKMVESYLYDKEPPDEFGKQYIFNLKNPMEGLFERTGKDIRYTINLSKKVFYDIQTLGVYSYRIDRNGPLEINPLPFLLGLSNRNPLGDEHGIGPWVGDIVSVSNNRPDESFIEIHQMKIEW